MNKNYYAIIPANVRYNSELKANEKLLYGELTALTNEKGYCWATNGYFAELYSVSKQSVSAWISNLKDKGYINIVYVKDTANTNLEKRLIYIANHLQENLNPPSKNLEYPHQENFNTPSRKVEVPHQEKLKENNTINNTNNNTFNITKEHEEKNVCACEKSKNENPKELTEQEKDIAFLKEHVEDENKYTKLLATEDYKKLSTTKQKQRLINITPNPDLKERIKEFLDFRKAQKKTMTPRALAMLYKKLDSLAKKDETKIKLLEQSIYKGWLDIYPLSKKQDKPPAADEQEQKKGWTEYGLYL